MSTNIKNMSRPNAEQKEPLVKITYPAAAEDNREIPLPHHRFR